MDRKIKKKERKETYLANTGHKVRKVTGASANIFCLEPVDMQSCN